MRTSFESHLSQHWRPIGVVRYHCTGNGLLETFEFNSLNHPFSSFAVKRISNVCKTAMWYMVTDFNFAASGLAESWHWKLNTRELKGICSNMITLHLYIYSLKVTLLHVKNDTVDWNSKTLFLLPGYTIRSLLDCGLKHKEEKQGSLLIRQLVAKWYCRMWNWFLGSLCDSIEFRLIWSGATWLRSNIPTYTSLRGEEFWKISEMGDEKNWEDG